MSQVEAISRISIGGLWLAWLAYWIISAGNVKATRWREPLRSRAGHRVPAIFAALLLIGPQFLPPALRVRFLPDSDGLALAGLALVAAGLGFAVWARRHLGTNWSATVTVKKHHTLIRSGPYRLVRHPIYSGMLLGVCGNAVAFGEWRCLLALALLLGAFIYKSRTEERRMMETFPEYAQYRRETAALIPAIY